MSYQMMCVLAHLKIHDGVGGRRDMVQELQQTWKAQLSATATPLEQWQDFKIYYCKKLEEFDYEGITTKQAKQARSVISQETINQHTNDHLKGIQDQLDALTHAMSVMSQQTNTPVSSSGPAPGIVPAAIVPTPSTNSFTSALTHDQSFRLLQEERIRNDKLRQEINRLKQAMHSGDTISTSPTVASTITTSDERIKHKDSKGNNWFQIAHYCSKHGYNHTHSNANCRDKHKPSDHYDAWVEGATHQDHKGGSNRKSDKYLQWFNPFTKKYTSDIP